MTSDFPSVKRYLIYENEINGQSAFTQSGYARIFALAYLRGGFAFVLCYGMQSHNTGLLSAFTYPACHLCRDVRGRSGGRRVRRILRTYAGYRERRDGRGLFGGAAAVRVPVHFADLALSDKKDFHQSPYPERGDLRRNGGDRYDLSPLGVGGKAKRYLVSRGHPARIRRRDFLVCSDIRAYKLRGKEAQPQGAPTS